MTQSQKVLVFCNPLLDISSNVASEFLEKYQLLPGSAILADEKVHGADFFRDLQNQQGTQFIPGGSGMNTARICSWVKQEAGDVCYIGCVGRDKYADLLTSQAKKDGVVVDGMSSVEGTPTGLCGVCITQKERSLVAALGAANKFSHEHLKNPQVQQLLEEAQIVYLTGFCLTVSQESVFEFANHCASTNKILAINISAEFIAAVFKDALIALLALTDIVFCNDTEAKALAQALSMSNTLSTEEIAQQLVLQKALKPNGKQMVVFTCGKEPTVLAIGQQVHTFPVKPINEDAIIDMNGAGDAFVGGFLAMYSKGEPIKRCVNVGHYAAGVIIQHSGCQFPQAPSLELA